MAIPANGYLGNPARTTLEFQTGIDGLVEGINHPTTGLDAKSSVSHNHDADYAGLSHNHDAEYFPSITNADLKSALNGTVTNWVLKWGPSSALNVPVTWGPGTYLVKAGPDECFVIEVTNLLRDAYSECAPIFGKLYSVRYQYSNARFYGQQTDANLTRTDSHIQEIYKAE